MRVAPIEDLLKRGSALKLHESETRFSSRKGGMKSPQSYFSAPRVMADIKAIVGHTRWMTTPEISRAAHYIKDQMQAVEGLEVELLEYLSDGRTSFGGWIMPKCWDVHSAKLNVVAAKGRKELILADYHANPFSLMMWSPATPPDGIKAFVAVVAEPFKNGRALKGKFALMTLPQIAVEHVAWAAENGAVGVISDTMITRKGVKEGKYLDDAIQYWNYTNPQWDGAPRLPAFGLTPKMGLRLRKLLADNPKLQLRACVDAQLYDGTLPLVTARLPGLLRKEFVITAHMDEPGASDNTSGTALAMETMRCLAEHARKSGEIPAVSIRFFASVEARGLQAYLNTRPGSKYGYAGGLNLDMIGYEQSVGRSGLTVTSVQPTAPSVLAAIIRERLAQETLREPKFTFKEARGVVLDDCQFAGAPFHAPMVMVEQVPDKTYHSSLDTVENLSPAHLKRMGGVVLDTVGFFARGDLSEVAALGERLFNHYATSLQQDGSHDRRILQDAKALYAQLLDFFPQDMPILDAQQVSRMRENNLLVDGYLLPKFAFAEKVNAWTAELKRLAALNPALPAAPAASVKPLPALLKTARAMVPVKTFAGYLGFEDLTRAELLKLKNSCGIERGWGAPSWLQWALDLATGKRSLLDIYAVIAPEQPVDLQYLVHAILFLRARGLVKIHTALTKDDVTAAIKKAGIRSGDIVMAHSALSDFGYLDGGADTLIDALLEIVGPTGTVCVPTHSLNWIGKAPYDPKTSPSYTGAVPAAFLKRPNAQRSLHPTHSVAAIGPHAAELIAGHDHTVAPQAREGFWGNFVKAQGKVLMLCRLQSNTLLHSGELWGGIPMPTCVAHVQRNGERVEFTLSGMPWHVHAFDLVHDELNARGHLYSSPLGASKIYAMDAREAVDLMTELIKKDPTIALREKCDCFYCDYVRKRL